MLRQVLVDVLARGLGLVIKLTFQISVCSQNLSLAINYCRAGSEVPLIVLKQTSLVQLLEVAAKLDKELSWELVRRLLKVQKVFNLVSSLPAVQVTTVESLTERVALICLEHEN